ncbi:beta-1,3-galactosyl-O-glycosyl-glycoprotein beta-1,6-N-acetylglucosaminyltransferase-like [Petromyzon marinus]|uniref:beta-1,3-galactosyl-O-glycosyl-glycoprotein beta-1,6-N-acetylglucosaminyltransferase-like n=1 Tax=Petromyzon marinus TaxID=7757 RepID=UPI003F729A4C
MGQAVKWNRKGVIVCAAAIATGAVFLVCVRSHSVPREPRGHGETWDLSRYELPDMDPRFPVNCSAVVRGDEESIAEAMLLSITVEFNKRRPLAEDDYLRMTRDCDAFKRDRRYVTVPLSDEEAAFPIAYSVVAHHRVDMLERLLRAIYAPQNVYCLHVDQKSPPPYQEAVRALAACFPNVFLARRQERVVYTSWLRVQADLNCMRDLVAAPQPWKYFINLCGLDFPIKTNLEMVRALRTLNGKNSMESLHTPRDKTVRWEIHHEIVDGELHATHVRKSPPPIPTPMFSGNAYIVVTRAFVEHVLSDPTARALIEWEKDTFSPDEHLWATLQRLPGVPGSSPPHDKYDVQDMMAIARLVRWSYMEGDTLQGAAYPPCRGTVVRWVCVNGVGDLPWALRQHHLFVNKVDSAVDDVAVHCLERHLRSKALGEAVRPCAGAGASTAACEETRLQHVTERGA